jgi:hypothetical protein
MRNAPLMFAVLTLACASAAAGPTPTPAKPAAGAGSAASGAQAPTMKAAAQPCQPGNSAVVFEIDKLAEPEAKLATSLYKVYANGAWTKDNFDTEGNKLPQNAGCYTADSVKTLQATLTGAEWKVSTAAVHCMAVSPAYTTYRVNGKSVFIRKLCSGDSLDQKSMDKLQAAIAACEGTVPAGQ